MPIPQRKQGQSEDTFISECIADLSGEYDTAQAAAICYQQLNLEIYNFRKSLMKFSNPSFTGNSYSGGMGMKKRKNISNKK
jgi:hypothetical protein